MSTGADLGTETIMFSRREAGDTTQAGESDGMTCQEVIETNHDKAEKATVREITRTRLVQISHNERNPTSDMKDSYDMNGPDHDHQHNRNRQHQDKRNPFLQTGHLHLR